MINQGPTPKLAFWDNPPLTWQKSNPYQGHRRKPHQVFNGYFRPQEHRPVPRYSNVPESWPGAIPSETQPFLPILPSPFPQHQGRASAAPTATKSRCSLGAFVPGAFLSSRTDTNPPATEDVFGSLARITGFVSLRVHFLPRWREVNFMKSLNSGVCFTDIIIFTRWKVLLRMVYPAEWWQAYLIFNCLYMQESGKYEYNMQEQLLYFIISGRYFKINKTFKKIQYTFNICYFFSNPLNPFIYSKVV